MLAQQNLKCPCMLQQHRSAYDRNSLSGTKSELCCYALALPRPSLCQMPSSSHMAKQTQRVKPDAFSNAKTSADANAKQMVKQQLKANAKHTADANANSKAMAKAKPMANDNAKAKPKANAKAKAHANAKDDAIAKRARRVKTL